MVGLMQADRSAVARELGIGMLNLLEQMQPPAIHPSQPGSPDLFEIVGGDAQAANPKDSPEKESPSEQADMQQVNAAMGHLSTGGQVERRKKRLSPRRLSSCYSRNTSTLHMWQVGLLHLSMRQGARGQLMTWTAPTRRCTNGH